MKRKKMGASRRLVIRVLIIIVIVLAILLYIGSNLTTEQQEQEVEEVQIDESEQEVEEVQIDESEQEVEEVQIDESEQEEELIEEEINYVLSSKDCKCYSEEEEVPEGNLDCKIVFGLVGCSETGVTIKVYMVDDEGNVKEKYKDQLGL